MDPRVSLQVSVALTTRPEYHGRTDVCRGWRSSESPRGDPLKGEDDSTRVRGLVESWSLKQQPHVSGLNTRPSKDLSRPERGGNSGSYVHGRPGGPGRRHQP